MTALPNGYLVLVGGVSSSNEDFAIGKEANVLLKDVWTMRDPRRVIPNLVFSSDNNAIDLIPGHVTSHVTPVSLRDEVHGVSVGEEDMCINRLTVKFSFDHICPNGIHYIKLTGPGTAARGTADHDAPQSRDYETKVSFLVGFCCTTTFRTCSHNGRYSVWRIFFYPAGICKQYRKQRKRMPTFNFIGSTDVRRCRRLGAVACEHT